MGISKTVFVKLTVPNLELPEQFQETLYVHSADRQRHFAVMHEIATEARRPVDEVVDYYEEMLRELKAWATIPDYIPIFVAKRVRQIYKTASTQF